MMVGSSDGQWIVGGQIRFRGRGRAGAGAEGEGQAVYRGDWSSRQ